MTIEQFYINTLEKGVNVPFEAKKWLYDEWKTWDLILRNQDLRTPEFLSYYSKLTLLVLNINNEKVL